MQKIEYIEINGIVFQFEKSSFSNFKAYYDALRDIQSQKSIATDDNSIEKKISSLLLTRLSSEKTYLIEEDIKWLIDKYGSIEKIEKKNSLNEVIKPEAKNTQSLQRLIHHQVLTGIVAGISEYLGVEILFFRLATFFFCIFCLLWSLSTLVWFAIGYVVLLLILPVSNTREVNSTIKLSKKDEKNIFFGVARALGKNLKIDETLIRAAFSFLSLFLGVGFFLYALTTILIPREYHSSHLSSLRKKAFSWDFERSKLKVLSSVYVSKEGSFPVLNVILVPFLVAIKIKNFDLAPITESLIKPLKAVSILLGGVLYATSLTALLTTISGLFIYLFPSEFFYVLSKAFSGAFIYLDILLLVKSTIPLFLFLATAFLVIIPCFLLLKTGLFLVKWKSNFFSAKTIGIMASFWFFSIIGTAYLASPFLSQYSSYSSSKEVSTLSNYDQKQPFVVFFEERYKHDLYKIDFNIFPSEDKNLKVVTQKIARGNNPKVASTKIKRISYEPRLSGNEVIIPSHFSLEPNSSYRFQKVMVELYIPANLEFQINIKPNNYMSSTGSLKKLSPNKTFTLSRSGKLNEIRSSSFYSSFSQINLDAFDTIKIQGNCVFKIKKGDTHAFFFSDTIQWFKLIDLKVLNSSLLINTKDNKRFTGILYTPQLTKLELKNNAKCIIPNFDSDSMLISIKDNVSVKANLQVNNLKLTSTGESMAFISGRSKFLELNCSGKSLVNLQEFQVDSASVTVFGFSKADIFVTEKLKFDSSIQSHFSYKGNPEVLQGEP